MSERYRISELGTGNKKEEAFVYDKSVASFQVIINVGLMNKVLAFDEVTSNLIFRTTAASVCFVFGLVQMCVSWSMEIGNVSIFEDDTIDALPSG